MSPSLPVRLARSTWLFFPFTSSSVHDKEDAQQSSGDRSRQRPASSGTDNRDSSEVEVNSNPDRSPRSPRSPTPVEFDTNTAAAIVALAFLLGSATALGASTVYRRFFKRIKSAEYITPDLFGRKRWITGVVTRCVLQ
jgi:hypothetical protein